MHGQFEVTTSKRHLDFLEGEDVLDAYERYRRMWGNFVGKMPEPVIEEYEGGRYILRADLAPAGLKAFGAEKFISEIKEDILVYVAPRVGHAPDAIAALAQMYGKKCVFFCPAAKDLSKHQRALLAYPHVSLKFFRTAAMPMLNGYAKKWAEEFGAAYLPFGLTKTPLVTAGLVNLCRNVSKIIGHDPAAAFMAVSTGTMIRALQIGWPTSEMFGVAVARNIKDGEIGRAWVNSHNLPFLKDEIPEYQPPFPSTSNYDAKAWNLFDTMSIPGSIFINVGSDEHIERNLESVKDHPICSQREWNDKSDWYASQSAAVQEELLT